MKMNRLLVLTLTIITLAITQSVRAQADSAPIGSIVAWPGQANTIPAGWMECDGRELSNSVYGRLFASIGTTWGGVGTTRFKIPDLRGYFLRGVSGTSNVDPDKTSRTPVGSAPQNAAGSIQSTALQDHTHSITGHHLEASGGTGFDGSGFDANSSDVGWKGPYPTRGVNPAVPVSAAETRPKNAYVFWIIRAQ